MSQPTLNELLNKLHKIIYVDIKLSEQVIDIVTNMAKAMANYESEKLHHLQTVLQQHLNSLEKHHHLRLRLANVCGFQGDRALHLLLKQHANSKNSLILTALNQLESNLHQIQTINLANGHLLTKQHNIINEIQKNRQLIVKA